MFPTRRAALAAMAAPLVPPVARAVDTGLSLSTFQAEVTLPLGHPCMGGGIAPAKEIVDPLFAHGFVLRGAGKPVVFLAVDWCEIRNGAYDSFREAVAKAVETEALRVMLCAVHQHDAPVVDTDAQKLLDEHKTGAAIGDPVFFEKAIARVAAAAKVSLKTASTVTHIGTGQATVEKVASNRRYVEASGQVRHNRMSATRDAKIRDGEEGTIDPVLRTLSFWNGDTALAALSAYATHPMSNYGKGGVSADFPGLARKRRQADLPDVPQIYASGCSGNVTAGKYNDGDPANRAVLADRLYKAMAAAWKATKKTPVTSAVFRSVPLKLEARDTVGFTADELRKRLTTDPKPFGKCLAALGLSWKTRVAAGRAIDVPILDFGTAAMLVLPAEAYVEFQLLAQKQRPDGFVLVAGYGECGPGYIPIEQAWEENDTNLGDWCWVAKGSEKKLTTAIVTALRTR